MINQNTVTEFKDKDVAKPERAAAKNTLVQKQFNQYQQSMIDNKYYIEQSWLGGELYTPKGAQRSAFRDAGDAIVVKAKAPSSVAKDVVMLAAGKGWNTIQVKGKKDFKRDVWIEASMKGLAVYGYTPTEQDQRIVNTEKERAQRTSTKPTSETQKPVGTDTSVSMKDAKTAAPRMTKKVKDQAELEALAEQYAQRVTVDKASQLEIQAAVLKNFAKVKAQYASVPTKTTQHQAPNAKRTVKAATPQTESAKDNAR